MPTTTLGIAYPSLTDEPRGPEQMQALAEDVDGLVATDRTARDVASSSWTPVITGSSSGTWTAGGTTIVAKYIRKGRVIHFWIDLTLGASVSISGSTTGTMLVSLPIAAASVSPAHVGTACLIEASGGRWVAAVEMNTTTTVIMVLASSGSPAASGSLVNNQTPNGNVWATGDIIRLEGTYEAATA